MKKWSEEEIVFLKCNYHKGVEYVSSKLDRSKNSVAHKACKLGIFTRSWTDEHNEILRRYYGNISPDKIAVMVNKSIQAVRTQAGRIGLNSDGKIFRWKDQKKHYSLRILLEDIPETFYWLGFLFADGHFSDKGRVVLGISEKDIGHIDKFCDFVGRDKIYNRQKGCVSTTFSDKLVVDELMRIYSLVSNKTYHPPDLNFLHNINLDLSLSFIIGFIDGDGHISKNGDISIILHHSWKNQLDLIGLVIDDRIGRMTNNKRKTKKLKSLPRIYGDKEYSVIYISDSFTPKKLKGVAEELNLPILYRKWSRVILDEN